MPRKPVFQFRITGDETHPVLAKVRIGINALVRQGYAERSDNTDNEFRFVVTLAIGDGGITKELIDQMRAIEDKKRCTAMYLVNSVELRGIIGTGFQRTDGMLAHMCVPYSEAWKQSENHFLNMACAFMERKIAEAQKLDDEALGVLLGIHITNCINESPPVPHFFGAHANAAPFSCLAAQRPTLPRSDEDNVLRASLMGVLDTVDSEFMFYGGADVAAPPRHSNCKQRKESGRPTATPLFSSSLHHVFPSTTSSGRELSRRAENFVHGQKKAQEQPLLEKGARKAEWAW